MEVDKLLHMTGVNHTTSYAENSRLQAFIIEEASKAAIESSLKELIKSFNQHLPNNINVADLGCSSGPTAFLAMKLIMPIVIKTCQENNQEPPSFQLFLNDLAENDFNGLFKSLPGFYEQQKGFNGGRSSCFVAAMPGSFYGRLFPDESIHFMHSCYSLHWLSQVPSGLVSEKGEQLNKTNICWAKNTSPPSVHAAYSEQYKKDFTLFLKLRSKELTISGKMVLAFICQNEEEEEGVEFTEVQGNTFHDMVKEGLIKNDKLESFNLPIYFPSIEEIKDAIAIEGSFKINHLDKRKRPQLTNGQKFNGYIRANSQRAVFEPIFASHFGDIIMDDFFIRYGKKLSELNQRHVNTVIISLSKE